MDNLILQSKYDYFVNKDKQIENKNPGSKYYFSIYATIVENGQESETTIGEYETGAERFKELIEQAMKYNPEKLEIITYSTKKETRRKGNKTEVILKDTMSEKTSEIKNNILQDVRKVIDEFRENLKSGQTEGLGSLGEIQLTHAIDKSNWKTEEKLKELDYERRIERLENQIQKLQENVEKQNQEIEEWENDYNELEKELDEYKSNVIKKFKTAAGPLAGLLMEGIINNVGKIPGLQGLLGGSAETTQAGPKADVESSGTASRILAHISDLVSNFNEEELEKFYYILVVIAQDTNNLDVIYEFVKQEEEETEKGGGNG